MDICFIWRMPCMAEIKYLHELYRKYEKNTNFAMLSIAANTKE
jgi:hypothetical protein